jgi:hypothetical protein
MANVPRGSVMRQLDQATIMKAEAKLIEILLDLR